LYIWKKSLQNVQSDNQAAGKGGGLNLNDTVVRDGYVAVTYLNRSAYFSHRHEEDISMKVNTELRHDFTTQRQQSSITANTNPASFSSALAAATADTTTVNQADFTSMTRKEMFDWMNDQIRGGKMSLDEGSPFLGMTMKISVATGQPVDMATDTARINFVEKARLGVEAARANNDQDLEQRLLAAIETMRRQSATRA
jgi:hypothetical protein